MSRPGALSVLTVVMVTVMVTAAVGPGWHGAVAGATPGPGFLHQSTLLSGSTSDTTRKQGGAVAVSADGRTVVVGAPANRNAGHIPGRVYVFAGDAGSWTLQATLAQPANPAPASLAVSNWGATVAISGDGAHIAVGNPASSWPGAGRVAAVDLFQRTGTAWSDVGPALDPHSLAYSQFGSALALSADGSRLLVGESAYTGPDTRGAGMAWLYATASGGGWGAPHALLPPPAPAYAQFGQAVALSGDGQTALVASIATEDFGDSNDGRVFSYTAGIGNAWARGHIFDDPYAGRDAFGKSVALSADGRAAAIGNPYSVPPTVTVYESPRTYWALTGTFYGVGTALTGAFGQDVAMSADGRTVLAGAPDRSADHGADPDAGGAYRFVRDETGWHWGGQLTTLTTQAYKNVGASVALSADGTTAVLGAPFYGRDRQDNFRHPGAAYVFAN